MTFPWSISRDGLKVSHFLLVIVVIRLCFLENPIFIAILVGPDGCVFKDPESAQFKSEDLRRYLYDSAIFPAGLEIERDKDQLLFLEQGMAY